jgi:hypothetical protein
MSKMSNLPRTEVLFFKITASANKHATHISMVLMAIIAWKLATWGENRQAEQ